MMRVCPRSCGICEHACSDANLTCVAWALGGECESNAAFMLRHCPTSCGICTPECKDHMPECAGWAHLGECAKNPDFAHRKCPVSCGVCKSACKDTNSSCGGWAADGQCDSNPGFMYVTCPLACDVCSGPPGDCDDVSSSTECKDWISSIDDNALQSMQKGFQACANVTGYETYAVYAGYLDYARLLSISNGCGFPAGTVTASGSGSDVCGDSKPACESGDFCNFDDGAAGVCGAGKGDRGHECREAHHHAGRHCGRARHGCRGERDTERAASGASANARQTARARVQMRCAPAVAWLTRRRPAAMALTRPPGLLAPSYPQGGRDARRHDAVVDGARGARCQGRRACGAAEPRKRA